MDLLWEEIWEWDSVYIDRALDGSDAGREDLLSLAKLLLRTGRGLRDLDRPGRGSDDDLSRERETRARQRETTLLGPVLGALTAYEQRRSFLVSQILARNASQEEHVIRFREKVLGRPLSRPEAEA